MKLKKRVRLTSRADLVALAAAIVQAQNSRRLSGHGWRVPCPMSPPAGGWQRAALIVRHHRPDLADQVAQLCKHKAVA